MPAEMLRRMLLTAGCVAAALSAGCGTMANQNGDYWHMTCAHHPPSEPYGGVRQDWDLLVSQVGWSVEPKWSRAFTASIALADLPLSATADTVLLPYDVWATMVGRGTNDADQGE